MSADKRTHGEQLEAYRRGLHAHCYRMLGSFQDAEDAVQDTLLQGWRGIDRFEGRSSLRSWLYSIATNVCLRMIERRPGRVLPVDYGPATDPHDAPGEPLVESIWVDPYPDERLGVEDGLAGPEARYEQRESLELAFIAALQHLPARQRAVLILRDVLRFSGAEVAGALDTTPASVYSLLQRAHARIDDQLPDRSQQATLRSLGDAQLREIVDRYVNAWERGDVDGVVSMLTEDARIAMPPASTWYQGRAAVAAFLAGWAIAAPKRWRLIPTRANGQLALGEYLWDPEKASFLPHGVTVLTLRGTRIADITGFIIPEVIERFGLPAQAPDPRGAKLDLTASPKRAESTENNR